jgi:hypothetical protein
LEENMIDVPDVPFEVVFDIRQKWAAVRFFLFLALCACSAGFTAASHAWGRGLLIGGAVICGAVSMGGLIELYINMVLKQLSRISQKTSRG